jgi:DNA-binding transcriptional MerR regulator
VHITEAARSLGVTAGYLRLLERTGQIPPARRDLCGRIYSELDLTLLRSMGIGSRPRKLRQADEVLERVR